MGLYGDYKVTMERKMETTRGLGPRDGDITPIWKVGLYRNYARIHIHIYIYVQMWKWKMEIALLGIQAGIHPFPTNNWQEGLRIPGRSSGLNPKPKTKNPSPRRLNPETLKQTTLTPNPWTFEFWALEFGVQGF